MKKLLIIILLLQVFFGSIMCMEIIVAKKEFDPDFCATYFQSPVNKLKNLPMSLVSNIVKAHTTKEL